MFTPVFGAPVVSCTAVAGLIVLNVIAELGVVCITYVLAAISTPFSLTLMSSVFKKGKVKASLLEPVAPDAPFAPSPACSSLVMDIYFI